MPYTKADVLRCLEAMAFEWKNRIFVNWCVTGKEDERVEAAAPFVKLLDALIEEGKTSIPEEPPREWHP